MKNTFLFLVLILALLHTSCDDNTADAYEVTYNIINSDGITINTISYQDVSGRQTVEPIERPFNEITLTLPKEFQSSLEIQGVGATGSTIKVSLRAVSEDQVYNISKDFPVEGEFTVEVEEYLE
jgi:hypothetical protein